MIFGQDEDKLKNVKQGFMKHYPEEHKIILKTWTSRLI